LGIGDWGLGPIPNPQSPIPNPQSPIPIFGNHYFKFFKTFFVKTNLQIKKLIIYKTISGSI
jgi:hypothetical protein